MSNHIEKVSKQTLSELLADTDSNVMHALRNSVYPGALDESIGMVLAYCKAKGYDPLAKAVHIVPMNVKNSKTNKYEWRDVIMPGIAAYRIDADRTGLHMGTSEPEFGPLITSKLGNHEFTYPEWCKISVKKFNEKSGEMAFFTSKELWIENYATKAKDKETGLANKYPNSMWEKRPFAQLAKCAEAQALRKAFPDVIDAVSTYEEMEGKEIKDITSSVEMIDDGHMKVLKELINEAGITEKEFCEPLKIKEISEVPPEKWNLICRSLEKKIAKNKKLDELPINQEFSKKEEEFSREESLALDAKLVEEE